MGERSNERPFAPPYREFRLNHRVEVLGYVLYIPLHRMLCGWGAVLCAAAALWPMATSERSSRWLRAWDRAHPAAPPRGGSR